MDLKSLIAKMTAIENNSLTEGGVVDPVGEIRPGYFTNPPVRPTKKPEVKRLEKPLDDTDKKPAEKEVDEGGKGRAIGTVAGELVAPEFTPVSGMVGGAIGDKIGDKIDKSHDDEEVEEGWKEKAGAVALAGAAALGGAAPAHADGWDDIMRPVNQVYQAQRDINNVGRNVGLEVSKDVDRAGRDLQKIPFFGIDKFGKQMRGNYPYGAHPEPDRSPDAGQRQGQNAARNADLQGSEAAAGYGVNNNRGYKPYRINNFESKNMSKEQKCNECGMYESKCSCPDELAEMLKLSGLMKPYVIGEAKKKKPDADKDGIPDYAEDGKGKMEEGAMPMKKVNGKSVPAFAADSKGKNDLSKKKVEEDDVEEGNEFSGELAKAKSSGQKEFEVDGKKYKVKEATSADLMKRWAGIFEAEEKCADCGKVHTGDCAEDTKEKVDEVKMADLPSRTVKGKSYGNQDDYERPPEDKRRPAKTMPLKKDKKPLGEAMEECMDGGEGGMDDNFSINSSMDSSGHKSVSITASGSKADELTNILRNAGLGVMGGSDHAEPDADNMGGMDDMDGDVEVVSVPLAQHDGYQAPEHEEEMDEAAKYRDPKYKDQLYTQEPLDHTFGPDMDDAYYNDYPDDYAGRKRPMHSGTGDPLEKWHRMSAKNSINTQGKRAGLPSRDQITSLKQSIKNVHGQHARPNLPEEADEGYRNEPHAQVQSVSAQMRQGNDLNREKDMHKHSYRQGDNPMAMEDQQAAARLEKELMEELSSLKVVSEKYMGFGKTVGALKKQGGVKDPEALAASIGRKKYGKDKFQKAAAAGKKLG